MSPSPTSDSPDEPAPPPPSLHWALLLLIDIATVGIFSMIWCFVQAKFARKVTESNAAYWYAAWLMLLVATSALQVTLRGGPVSQEVGLFYGLLTIVCLLSYQVGNFGVKNAVEAYYDSTEESGRRLSGLMTIFFGQIYLQYHMCRLAKKAQLLVHRTDP